MRPSPVRRLVAWSSSARSAYRANGVEYRGPGSPLRVRGPRPTARRHPGVSGTEDGIAPPLAAWPGDVTGAGTVPALRPVEQAVAASATVSQGPADFMEYSVYATRMAYGRPTSGAPSIYGLRYVTRSPVRVAVSTSAPLLNSPVTSVDWEGSFGSTRSRDTPAVVVVPNASTDRPVSRRPRPDIEIRPANVLLGKYGDE